MTPDRQSAPHIVTTPTFDWLAENATRCCRRLLIASPFVNSGIIDVVALLPPLVDTTLITRTDLRDFAIGASSLGTLCTLARNGVGVRSLSSLHAKMYIFDDKCALVTSANATNSGLRHNLECGLAIEDNLKVAQLTKTLLKGFDSDIPRVKSLQYLERLKQAVASIKASMPIDPSAPFRDVEPEFIVTDSTALLDGFRGWTNLTLTGVLALPPGDFELMDLVKVCEPLAEIQYPKNRHVRAKIRQQLQVLRGHGLVDFVNYQGVYRRTL